MEFKHQNVQEVDLMHPKGRPNDSGCSCTINANYGIIYFGYAYNWDSNCINDNPEICPHYPNCQMNVEPDLS